MFGWDNFLCWIKWYVSRSWEIDSKREKKLTFRKILAEFPLYPSQKKKFPDAIGLRTSSGTDLGPSRSFLAVPMWEKWGLGVECGEGKSARKFIFLSQNSPWRVFLSFPDLKGNPPLLWYYSLGNQETNVASRAQKLSRFNIWERSMAAQLLQSFVINV